MKLFYSNGRNEEGENIVEEKETDSIDIVSTKYAISIRTSGIQIKNRETGEKVDLTQENIIFDTNIDLT